MNKLLQSLPGLILIVGVLSTMAAMQPAHAYEDDSPLGRQNYEQNYLDRLHFRTPAQAFLGTFDFTPDIYYRSESFTNGTKTGQASRERFPIGLTGTIGITDLLYFKVSEGYLFHSVTQNYNDSTSVQTSSASSGLSDPTLTFDYRYLGGLTGTVFGDAFINFSPSAGDDQAANFQQNGNYLRGNTTLELGTDIFTVAANNEFSLGGSWVYNSGRTVDAFNTNNNQQGSNYSYFDLRLRYRYHFNEFVFMQVQGTLYMPYTTNTSYYNSDDGRTSSSSYPFYAVPRVTLGFLPNNFTLYTVGLYYTGYTLNSTPTTDTSSSSNSTISHEVALDLGASFLL